MTSFRLWITILALVSFTVGIGSGLLFARKFARPEPQRGAFAEYELHLAQTFDLSPERKRLLRVVLSSYEREIEEIKDRHMADTMLAMEPELCVKGRALSGLIRDKVLPENKRSQFDHLAFDPSPTRQ